MLIISLPPLHCFAAHKRWYQFTMNFGIRTLFDILYVHLCIHPLVIHQIVSAYCVSHFGLDRLVSKTVNIFSYSCSLGFSIYELIRLWQIIISKCHFYLLHRLMSALNGIGIHMKKLVSMLYKDPLYLLFSYLPIELSWVEENLFGK